MANFFLEQQEFAARARHLLIAKLRPWLPLQDGRQLPDDLRPLRRDVFCLQRE